MSYFSSLLFLLIREPGSNGQNMIPAINSTKNPNYRKETSQHPSLEVYFWYHHQNFYKTFSDNNILKEEPCFCACTGSPQKCFSSEYSKKNKNPNKKKKETEEKKSKTNNKPATKENNAAHIYTLQKLKSLCRKMMRRRQRVPLDLYEERFFKRNNSTRTCKETKTNSDHRSTCLPLSQHAAVSCGSRI